MKTLIKTSLLSGLIAISAPAFSNNANFELGLGIPYGGLGGNANFDIGNNIELFAGLGMALGAAEIGNDTEVAADLGYAAGARYYATPNIRLMAGYGTVGGILTKESTFSDDIDMETVEGGFVGLGYISGKNKGFTADLIFVDTKNFNDRIEELEQDGNTLEDINDNEVKIALGYRF